MVDQALPGAQSENGDDGLGKTGPQLTLWLIEEALKSGGEVLDRQEKSFDAKRAQATSMLGWFVSITTAITFATVSANKIAVGACIAALSTIPCCCCVYALMSKDWSYKQLHPQQTLEAEEGNERDYKLANSLGLQLAINDNSIILQKIDRALNAAWLTFCIIPIAGLLFYSIFS
ncbi:hypothetical protein AD948_04330 [Acetobacter senegalensis]|uniref:Uncharacterized protein n=1 Tax=Acetobacter senegalensis TaxID=446692 RepID=A0A149U5H2_9PROT|nr:hypothetical protein [Acetobacter senegalensis]KXV60658.1 hypothetical protein AD948_04330 [Acetobacter senegalensis]